MNVDRAAAFKDEVSACLREQGVEAQKLIAISLEGSVG